MKRREVGGFMEQGAGFRRQRCFAERFERLKEIGAALDRPIAELESRIFSRIQQALHVAHPGRALRAQPTGEAAEHFQSFSSAALEPMWLELEARLDELCAGIVREQFPE